MNNNKRRKPVTSSKIKTNSMYKCMHLLFFVDHLGPHWQLYLILELIIFLTNLMIATQARTQQEKKDKLWNFSNGAFLNPSAQLICSCLFSTLLILASFLHWTSRSTLTALHETYNIHNSAIDNARTLQDREENFRIFLTYINQTLLRICLESVC